MPRWRGFNLTEKGDATWGGAGLPYKRWDFDFIAKHGFNFVRLPLDYRLWTPSADGSVSQLQDIDHAVALAGARNIHVNLALFNVPGRVSSGPPEPDGIDLWADDAGRDEARRRFAGQWRMLAERYRGIPSTRLSFNLLNEPSGSIFRLDRTGQHRAYLRALSPAVTAIRAVDPRRLLIADALSPRAIVKALVARSRTPSASSTGFGWRRASTAISRHCSRTTARRGSRDQANGLSQPGRTTMRRPTCARTGFFEDGGIGTGSVECSASGRT